MISVDHKIIQSLIQIQKFLFHL